MADLPPPVPWTPAQIIDGLRAGGRCLVALSGGVDSAVVAQLAREALGDRAMAVTLTGPAVSDAEQKAARAAARAVGIAHEEVGADPLGQDEYRKNPTNRCYFCRKVETEALRRFGASRGIRQYLDGVHRDDLGDDRPGLLALEEAGFLHPLLRAGWDKAAVRAYARARGLPQWDRPSNACLASRIAHGQPITAELLGRIEAAEEAVRRHGFRRVRVRVVGPLARVEVGPEEVARLRAPAIEAAIHRALADVGFPSVEIDPRGYPARRGG